MEKISNITPYGLRMPSDLRERIQKVADRERRSLNFMICEALEGAFPADTDIVAEARATFGDKAADDLRCEMQRQRA